MLFLNNYSFTMYTYMCELVGVYVRQPHVCSPHKGQKRATDPVELELQATKSH